MASIWFWNIEIILHFAISAKISNPVHLAKSLKPRTHQHSACHPKNVSKKKREKMSRKESCCQREASRSSRVEACRFTAGSSYERRSAWRFRASTSACFVVIDPAWAGLLNARKWRAGENGKCNQLDCFLFTSAFGLPSHNETSIIRPETMLHLLQVSALLIIIYWLVSINYYYD